MFDFGNENRTVTKRVVLNPEIQRSAVFSDCRLYRYVLKRKWPMDKSHPHGKCVFIMLNPSTADEEKDDSTTRRCLKFAMWMGFSEYVAVNLFAYRSLHPADLRSVGDPVGPRNNIHVTRMTANATAVYVAWGNHGSYLGQDEMMLDNLTSVGVIPLCLGITKRKRPIFPLYLPDPFCPRPYKWPVG